MEFFQKLFDTDFMPHGHCYFWRPEILWPHVLGDVFTALAYFVIPILLYRFVSNRSDIRYPGVFLAFSLFILCCGVTHLLATVSVWNPIYRVEAVAKVTTAVVSMGTVGLLFRLYRPILAIPSPAQLEQANADLRRENEQRIETEKQLRISEQSFRASMDYAPGGMAQIEPNARWRRVNPALCRMLGYSEEELLTAEVVQSLHPDDRLSFNQVLRQLIEGEAEGRFLEVRCVHREGQLKWAMMGIAPVFNDRGQLLHFVLQLMDVTTQKEQQQEIMELNASLEAKVKKRTLQLQEANTELESFSYSVAHDLKAPAKNIEGLTILLHDLYADKLDEQGNELVQHVTQNAKRMNRLISGYLDFSRLGQQNIQKSDFDLTQEFQRVFEELRSAYVELPIHFSIDALPAAYGDPELIRQVVYNLLSNALKYSAKKSEIQIRVKGNREEGHSVYQISDNGVGFDPQSKEKLFRMFQRLHSETDFEGHGIGLAFSYRIVKRHGGRMWADSEPGRGATFYFSLPNR